MAESNAPPNRMLGSENPNHRSRLSKWAAETKVRFRSHQPVLFTTAGCACPLLIAKAGRLTARYPLTQASIALRAVSSVVTRTRANGESRKDSSVLRLLLRPVRLADTHSNSA